MDQYGPQEARLPGQAASGLVPYMLVGIPFDSQPLPVEVPRESVAAAYNPSKSMFR
jgi:hypothetical protein